MFPFAFGVPLASRHNSPAATRSPPHVNSNPFDVRPIALTGEELHQDTYARKKANWKSSLRRPHPFLSREPSNGRQNSTSQSSHLKTDSKQNGSTRTSSRRSLLTIRRVLALCAIILSIVVVIVGVIYADKLAPQNTSDALQTTLPGNTKTGDVSTVDDELRMKLIKRIDTAPFPEDDPLDHADSDRLSRVLASMDNKNHTQPHSLVAQLFFYVAALPIVTMIHACIELAVLSMLTRLRRRRSETSPTPSTYDDDDSFCDSDTEDINEEKYKHELAYPALPVSPEFKPAPKEETKTSYNNRKLISVASIVSIIVSLLILQGWIAVSGIQIHCEFFSLGKNSKVCPSPFGLIGANENKGLRQMSIVRTTFSWAIILIYMVQIFITIKQYKSFSMGRFRRSTSGDAEASPRPSQATNPSPRTLNSILTRTRSRSNSSRRKTVRFELEAASRLQAQQGDDVQYIPAPSDGYDNGYGLTYNYSSNHAYAINGNNSSNNDVRTPWQWQGQFEEFVNRNHTTAGVNTNPVVAATLGTGLKISSTEKSDGSFNFGLASMRRLAREENAALAHKTGFHPSQLFGSRNSHGLSSHPTVEADDGIPQARVLTDTTSVVVPVVLSNTAVPFKPKFAAGPSANDLHRHDTVVSAMTNGRKSIDLDMAEQIGKRDVSPMSN